jgi:hypothetical protein
MKFSNGTWTWVSGDPSSVSNGVYGTKGISSNSNCPGSRYYSVSWIDSSNTFWLFGGYTYSEGVWGTFNDLWKFSNGVWTWESGGSSKNIHGVYGTQGIASTSNYPGARASPMKWIDSSGSLWLFGGSGFSSSQEGKLRTY